MTASQLKGCVLDPRSLSESPVRSLGKSVDLNRPGKKQISCFGLPPIAVTQNQMKKRFYGPRSHCLMELINGIIKLHNFMRAYFSA